jgi:hypothetical protein
MELPAIFNNICMNRLRSPIAHAGKSGAKETITESFLHAATGLIKLTTYKMN